MSGYADASADLVHAAVVATSTTAAALPAPAAGRVHEILIQNDPASTVNVLVGNSTAQVIVLQPGDSLTVTNRQPARVYVKSASATPNINVLYRGE